MYLLKNRKPERLAQLDRLRLSAARMIICRSSDPEIAEMMRVSAELDAKNFAGGWCQLLNYRNTDAYPFTHTANWTTISDITSASEVNAPCIPANSLDIGSLFHVRTW